jgi:hypothetical protein
MKPLLRLCAARQAKSYASGNDLFLFSVFWIVIKKTGNTGAEKLPGRTHPTMYGVYPLHRLLEDSSMKSYGEEKTHRNSTNNSSLANSHFYPLGCRHDMALVLQKILTSSIKNVF